MTDILLHLQPSIVAALFYAGLGVYFWLTRWHNGGRPLDPRPMRMWERGAIVIAMIFHGLSLRGIFPEAGNLHFSFSLAVSLMLWLAVLIYWLESFRSRMDGIQPIVLPLAAFSALLPAFFPLTHEIAHADTWGFKMHFLTAMLAYSLFTLAALHAVFMGIIQRQLHHKLVDPWHARLPSVLSLEKLLFRIIAVAFSLLTLALISGSLFSETTVGKALVFDHKTLFAFASWGIFAALLFGRHRYGWRGSIALRWTLVGFALLVLAYIGSRFVLEVLLGRI